MDFTIEHVFLELAPAAVASTFADAEFQRSLRDLPPLRDRHLLDQQEQPEGGVFRRLRCVLDIDLGRARAFVGDGDPAWIEEWRSNDLRDRWTWEIFPEMGGDLLASAGSMEIVGGQRGTVRRISGHVKVRVPLYGGKVERWIVDGLERAYDEEADRLRLWTAQGSPAAGGVTPP